MATIYRDEFGRDVYQDPNKGLLSATTGQPITSEMLASLATTNFQTPTIPPPPDVSKIDSEFKPETLGAESQKAQDLTTRIQSIQEQLLGQSSFRREQEEAVGLPAMQGTLKDLSARLTALKNQALAVPLQLQEQATGRGITAAGLAPIEAGELRKNAIQTLTVSSLFEAARGNLTTALDQVDRAVAAKYDPFLEEINVKLANLRLIQESPAYTLEQKNRAAKEEARQLAIKERKEAEKAEQEQIWRMAVEAAQTAAEQGIRIDAFTLDKIQKAKTKEEALRLATPFLQKVKQNTFEQRLDPQGNLIELELNPQGKIVGQKIISKKGIVEEIPEVDGVGTPLSATERKETRSKVDAGEELLDLTRQYRNLVATKGFTSPIFGDKKILGQVRSLRGQITSAYKDARKLGTLDEGVLRLMEQVIGEEPIGVFKNLFGGRSRAIVAQLDSLIQTTEASLRRDRQKLGTTDISGIIFDDDLQEIDNILNLEVQGTTPFSSFNPSVFY